MPTEPHESDPFEIDPNEDIGKEIQEDIERIRKLSEDAALDEAAQRKMDLENEFGEIVDNRTPLGEYLLKFAREKSATLKTVYKNKPRGHHLTKNSGQTSSFTSLKTPRFPRRRLLHAMMCPS